MNLEFESEEIGQRGGFAYRQDEREWYVFIT